MSTDVEIGAHEHGRVHVFTLAPGEEGAAIRRAFEAGDTGPLEAALGAGSLDPGEIDILAVKDLHGIGLSGYLVEGAGVTEAQIDADRARLDAVEGHVVALRSAAFRDAPQTVSASDPLSHLGSYDEARAAPAMRKLSAESARARPAPGPPPPPEARQPAGRGMILGVAAAALAILVVIVLIAGRG